MSAPADASLGRWIADQRPRAIAGMLLSVSPLAVVKTRPGFGQVIRPRPGAIVASPVPAAYDPDPDYFFHWLRDSALVVDAMRLLMSETSLRASTLGHLQDFLDFCLTLQKLDGRALTEGSWRSSVLPDFVRYLRDEQDLAQAHGPAIGGEVRFNADASLDISRWARPQHDGPALRALALLRWLRSGELPDAAGRTAMRVLRQDLAYAREHAHETCFDIWEEERALHYYTLRVCAAALEQGARWLQEQHEQAEAAACSQRAEALYATLDGFWDEVQGYYRSRLLEDGQASPKALDIAVLLAAVHAGAGSARHDAGDPRMHATLEALSALFAKRYAINQGLPASHAPALGRYEQDVYYSGGAYYFSTLGATEFCYQAAGQAAQRSGTLQERWFARGEAYMRTVHRYTPASGELSEQFDQHSGRQTSAKQLSWSYAAFLTCIHARQRALAMIG